MCVREVGEEAQTSVSTEWNWVEASEKSSFKELTRKWISETISQKEREEGNLGREECRLTDYKTESIAWTRTERFEFFKHKPSDIRDLRIIWSPQWEGSVRGLSLNVCIQLAWPRGQLAYTLYSSSLSLMQEHRLTWSCFGSTFLFPQIHALEAWFHV